MSNVLVGTIIVEKEYPDEISMLEALEAFGDEFDTDPETINGKGFVGTCDGCGKIILDDEIYAEDDDESLRCNVCIDKNQKELVEDYFQEGFRDIREQTPPIEEQEAVDVSHRPEETPLEELPTAEEAVEMIRSGEEAPSQIQHEGQSYDHVGKADECSMPLDMQADQMRDEGATDADIEDFLGVNTNGDPDWPMVSADSEDPEDL